MNKPKNDIHVSFDVNCTERPLEMEPKGKQKLCCFQGYESLATNSDHPVQAKVGGA